VGLNPRASSTLVPGTRTEKYNLGVVELADTVDLKPTGRKADWGFDAPHPDQTEAGGTAYAVVLEATGRKILGVQIPRLGPARVTELADVQGREPWGRNTVQVQLLSCAPNL
jgi:hypothetical protein